VDKRVAGVLGAFLGLQLLALFLGPTGYVGTDGDAHLRYYEFLAQEKRHPVTADFKGMADRELFQVPILSYLLNYPAWALAGSTGVRFMNLAWTALALLVFWRFVLKSRCKKNKWLWLALPLLAFLPHTVFYAQAVGPEAVLLLASALSTAFFLRFLDGKGNAGLNGLATGLPLLVKLNGLALPAAALLYLGWRYWKDKKLPARVKPFLAGMLVVIAWFFANNLYHFGRLIPFAMPYTLRPLANYPACLRETLTSFWGGLPATETHLPLLAVKGLLLLVLGLAFLRFFLSKNQQRGFPACVALTSLGLYAFNALFASGSEWCTHSRYLIPLYPVLALVVVQGLRQDKPKPRLLQAWMGLLFISAVVEIALFAAFR